MGTAAPKGEATGFASPGVLVHLDSSNRTAQTWWLITKEIYFLQFRKVEIQGQGIGRFRVW